MNIQELKPNKSRYALIDRVLGRKTNSTDDLFDFCIMMFNSNKEKYQAIVDQQITHEALLKLYNISLDKIESANKYIALLWFAVVCNFILLLVVLGLITK